MEGRARKANIDFKQVIEKQRKEKKEKVEKEMVKVIKKNEDLVRDVADKKKKCNNIRNEREHYL